MLYRPSIANKLNNMCFCIKYNLTILSRAWLKEEGLLHEQYKAKKINENLIALPIVGDCKLAQHQTLQLIKLCSSYQSIQLPIQLMQARRHKGGNAAQSLHQAIATLYKKRTNLSLSSNLTSEIPHHWIKHDDLILLPANAFTSQEWNILGDELWHIICSVLGIKYNKFNLKLFLISA